MAAEDAVIRLEQISKCYRIFENPQDRFKQALRERLGRWMGPGQAPLFREHWALRDVSFEVARGEAVGILGRNGAGKSTLLQIIAGTLTPSAGQASIQGRVTALLELGSGFNPEFTGRENVFHNAQILGLSREEAEQRFDGIAAFADIGEFLDQPVKTYSSGMVMRLAFAVQTSVSPQILIVDEALSVGDMFFQAKCMARISGLVDQGVTLLFVSHDIGSVRQVCRRSLLVENGRLVGDGQVAKISDQYLKKQLEERNSAAQSRQGTSVNPANGIIGAGAVPQDHHDMAFGIAAFRERAQNNRAGNGTAEILNVQMLRDTTHVVDFDYDEQAAIRVYVRFAQALDNVNQSVKIRTLQGTDVVFLDTRLQNQMDKAYEAGQVYCFEWSLHLPLVHQQYGVFVALAHPPARPGDDWVFIDVIPHAYEFKIAPRSAGMIDGLVVLSSELAITRQGPPAEEHP